MKHLILENRDLGNAFVLKLERNNLEFKSGEHIELQLPGSPYKRPYSIYSGEKEDFIEFLIKEIPNGDTSPFLRKLQPGDYLELDHPDGLFTIDEKDLDKNFYLICTGTGIAPFHSFIKTYPTLKAIVYHGIRTTKERYEYEDYPNYFACVSKEKTTKGFNGRVTAYFETKYLPLDKDALYYLCGAGRMIYDIDKILIKKGISSKNIFWEVYHAERI